MNLDEVYSRLRQSGINIVRERRNGDNTGVRIDGAQGEIINVFDTGRVSVQGRNQEKVSAVLGLAKPPAGAAVASPSVGDRPMTRHKVFVVYGRDTAPRHELDAMLRRWELDPVILEDLPSRGATLIEKLENYLKENQVAYAVVLASPDDVGYPKGQEEKKQPRARQNVLLELGMVLALLGREHVAIFRPPRDQMEAPSDIDGLVYLEYTRSVSERKAELAKEIETAIPGFTVPATKL